MSGGADADGTAAAADEAAAHDMHGVSRLLDTNPLVEAPDPPSYLALSASLASKHGKLPTAPTGSAALQTVPDEEVDAEANSANEKPPPGKPCSHLLAMTPR